MKAIRKEGTAFNADDYSVWDWDGELDQYVQRKPTEEEMKAAKNRAKRERRARR